MNKPLPNFGPYVKEKKSLIADANSQKKDLLGDNKVQANRPARSSDQKVPSVQEVIGRALDAIGTYNDLDNRCRCRIRFLPILFGIFAKKKFVYKTLFFIFIRQHVVALIDPEMCINCGKCYMTCNDTGYQAIQFDPETHLPKVRNLISF